MLTLKNITDSEQRRSQQVYDDLQKHLSTRKNMEQEFQRLDSQCVELAAKLNDQKRAYSPLAPATESELIRLRYQRDDVSASWHKAREEKQNELDALSKKDCDADLDWCVKAMKRLAAMPNYSEERTYYDTTGNRRVKIGLRTAAKNVAKEKIKAAMHQMRSRYIPLAQYRERNAKLKAEIEDLDLSEVVPADMTYEEFQDLMIRPETPKMVSAVVGRDSFTKIGVPLREHVDDLIFQAEQQEKAKRRL